MAFVLTNKSPGMLRLMYSTVYGSKGTDLKLVSCHLSFAAGASPWVHSENNAVVSEESSVLSEYRFIVTKYQRNVDVVMIFSHTLIFIKCVSNSSLSEQFIKKL